MYSNLRPFAHGAGLGHGLYPMLATRVVIAVDGAIGLLCS